ncbi:SUF system NifU family Fe-S cluster assembly protein [bacterium]|nr:MAG: SUF system NifU family Fe-S cluster assembly protein [candidate division KSB1 bacterium]MCE7943369.1 SUF system NifU family Fe-S cluster assembly protein [Chlorobi bacterium CHB1]MCL4707043.1 SUF system NifU family Fe-S cluster assembly protein [bacterium]MDL1874535.1 SUF system NifU family Fe-S cluster assembly protein [Cytophagia bacterium CHB2]MBC6951330.1 SUF system NifU family Fe-S cluster assembly protein [candidate division KSB1 bacterium]
MDELRELYQQVILDHNKSPRNFGKLEQANHTSEGYNPLCGDRVNLYVELEGEVIKDISFYGHGCAISKASASVMTTLVKGKSIAEAGELFKKFQQLITSDPTAEIDLEEFDKLAIFAGVREFPMRVKCAGLAWHTLKSALEDGSKIVSTE